MKYLLALTAGLLLSQIAPPASQFQQNDETKMEDKLLVHRLAVMDRSYGNTFVDVSSGANGPFLFLAGKGKASIKMRFVSGEPQIVLTSRNGRSRVIKVE